jgi:uncharacterized phage protein (TIGR01671 family)
MTVEIFDKRRINDPYRVPGLGFPNSFWFEILDLVRVGNLINPQHTNDPLNITKAKARLLAKVIETDFIPKAGQEKSKQWLIDFLEDLFGFAVSDNKTRGLFAELQDIHQVDIYEGDIVLVTIDDEDPDSDFIHEVKYDSDAGCFPIEVRDGDYDYTTTHWAINSHYYRYEVVGNIYQNPELIKKDGE